MSQDLIQVIENDKSQTVATIIGATAATVIKAKKGSNTPVLFQAKSSSRILDYFGIPDVGSEGIDDVLTYNSKYPIWVSAPSTGGKYGGVLLTRTGTIPFVGGKASTAIDFSAIENTELAATMDGAATEVSFTISDYQHYVNQSINLTVNGTTINVTASNAEPEILTTTPDVGAGTYTRATGALTFTFDAAPSENTIVNVVYTVDRSTDAYCALFNKNPQADDLQIKVSATSASSFTVDLQKKPVGSTTFSTLAGFPKTASIVAGTKDGFGNVIYFPTLFANSDYIVPVTNTALVFDQFTADTTYKAFAGGVRGTTSAVELAAGWEFFKQTNKYAADIFFDTTSDTTIPALFQTLRTSYQKRSYYIYNMANTDYASAITASTSIMTDNKGIAFYWGWGKIQNTYTGDLNASSLQGRRALRLADMYDVFNGLAPAWYNENGTHGGQLGSGIVEMFYDADDDAQKLLEAARLNPTVFHPTFGVVLTRERTSQSMMSDYASISHTRLADYLIKNIIINALPYQSYKLNDFSHRSKVKAQIESIINPTVAEPFNLLRDYICKCDEENNNDDVLAREEFVVAVAIKFTPMSKYIKLYFTNSAQGSDVKEDV